MFLIVFVTLMISIASLMVQTASLQAAKLYRQQNGLTQTMMAWHGGATSLVKASPMVWSTYNLLTGAFPGGCTVTAGLSGGTNNIYLGGATAPVCPGGTLTTLSPPGYLASGYNIGQYTFYTIAYQANVPSLTNYVLTFAYATTTAVPLNASTGNLIIPDRGGKVLGNTLQDLNAQLMRAVPNGIVFGSVQSAGILTAASVSASLAISYQIPTWVPVGSIAMISLGS